MQPLWDPSHAKHCSIMLSSGRLQLQKFQYLLCQKLHFSWIKPASLQESLWYSASYTQGMLAIDSSISLMLLLRWKTSQEREPLIGSDCISPLQVMCCMQADQTSANWDKLPADLLIRILQTLDSPLDLKMCRLASKEWEKITSDTISVREIASLLCQIILVRIP